MGLSFLRFGFLVLVFAGVFVVPVHVRKRKGRLEPAIDCEVFSETEKQKIPRSVPEHALGLLLVEDKPTAVLNARLVRWQQKTKAKPPSLIRMAPIPRGAMPKVSMG
jgi:hypothetical protein